MPKATILLAALTAIIAISGCDSQAKQAVKHDEEMRQQVQELKKKSKAYPVHGSDTNHYIP